MYRVVPLAIAILFAAPAATAWCHGTPIRLTVADNRLDVSAGMPDPAGFAPQIFVETGSAGDPENVEDFTGFGQAAFWLVPGFHITSLAENSGLYLEALARPASGDEPGAQRLLWYWNPESEAVETAPDTQLQIRRSASVNILLTPQTIAAPPIKIAAPVANDMNRHNHDLVRYLLPYPLPAAGAYAFFARLTSDFYLPSDPFLVVINNGVEYDQIMGAALAINLAANSLPGDFNHDGTVDAADYTVWRNDSLGPEKYTEWKKSFGAIRGAAASRGASTAAIPEPAWSAIALGCVLGCLSRRHRRDELRGRAHSCH